ncbi:DsbA family protein [Tengunoibacter tsumagoiensis]|uniref:Thioredoxin domain-containing protein n=1 Tax=Tengunoibacter tsumagoiensis TaxID=2014871 RepID=A0A402AAK5_9CHLR|nr:thioredoxin domain-containing protein [Tengunoibacter tsumagoiensis]GCE16149.1 hypothetical protein KTT_60080 [Tengunoibacter tsumagoiensis]
MKQEQSSLDLVLPVSQRDHAQGSDDAPLTLVEYGDYQCPDCGAAYQVVKAIKEKFGDKLRFVYRNFPLSTVHPHAQHAAEAAEAAGAQGKFWQMYEQLFAHQQELSDDQLATYIEEIGLDRKQLLHDLESQTYRQRVHEDLQSGLNSGVEGTPTFFINGVFYDDSYDVDTFNSALESALQG